MKRAIQLFVLPVMLIFSAQFVYADHILKFNVSTLNPQSLVLSAITQSSSLHSITLKTDTLKDKVEYSANEYVTFSKDKNVLSLYGKAQLNSKNFNITGDEIVYNKTTQKATAKNFTITNNYSNVKKSGSYGEFNLNDKTE
ncbi:hypothetical protein H7F33_09990 [Pedobacter sp. PAMC26386]|nr:hypothetical protein H7F33_09990 [Pedobacter sp. PAMC26386]